MTYSEMVTILRQRVAYASVKHCINKFGGALYQHRGITITITRQEMETLFINDVEEGARLDYPEEQALMFSIDLYCHLLSPSSTGQDVNISEVCLSDGGVVALDKFLTEMIDSLIATGYTK